MQRETIFHLCFFNDLSPYLSVLLRVLDHVHVHVVDQVGQFWHVLDHLVGLTGDVPLMIRKQTEEEITLHRREGKKKKESQQRITSVSLAAGSVILIRCKCVCGGGWGEEGWVGNYRSPVCNPLVIGKQISHFLPRATAPCGVSEKSRGCSL